MSTYSKFKTVAALCCMSGILWLVVGCGTSPIVSAMAKVGSGQIDTLTSTEIQAVVEKFAPGSSLTPEQADQFSQFLAQSQIKTLPELMPLIKVVTGQIDTLTADDILALAAKFAPNATLTRAQADAIVAFLAANNIKTLDQLKVLVDQVKTDPTSVQLPDGFLQLFEGFDTSTLPNVYPL